MSRSSDFAGLGQRKSQIGPPRARKDKEEIIRTQNGERDSRETPQGV
jgi:hypothetical protein